MSKRLSVAGIIAAAIALPSPHSTSLRAETRQLNASAPSNQFETVLLQFHNTERVEKGESSLRWSETLEGEAREWAAKLASERRMYHSTYDARNKAGENLWAGTASRFGPEAMMTTFLNERQYFRPGEFPKVSSTGKWQDVGHYTQIIWRSTEQVGCALESGGGFDFLVCRYWPSGNMMGTQIG